MGHTSRVFSEPTINMYCFLKNMPVMNYVYYLIQSSGSPNEIQLLFLF